MTATERFSRPPARFTEAALVKELEERGIGRPSTYAPTITKIMEDNRGYVVKETREGTERFYVVLGLNKAGVISTKKSSEMTGALKNHLVPTDMGMLVVDFLDKHFDEVMDYKFTAAVENQLDEVAGGSREWVDMISKFYTPFHGVIEKTMTEAERVSGERILGIDPVSGRTILVRMGKFGPVAQIGAPDELAEKEKPAYANLQKGQSIETITFDETMKLFELPKTIGDFEGSDLIIGIGRFGPYVKHKEAFISIPKGEDPMSVTVDRALELINEKRKADAPIFTYKSLPITKGAGRFGPFIKWNEMFINIPARFNIETLTLDEAIELIEVKVEKEGNRYIHNFTAEKITVENGRWGPFIRFGKKMINIKFQDKRATAEDAAAMSLEDIKKLIEVEIPNAFAKAAPKAKAATSKTGAAAKKVTKSK
jgi:DNA topoisomerase I